MRVDECENTCVQRVHMQVLKRVQQPSLLFPAADPNMKQPIRDLHLIAAPHCCALLKTRHCGSGAGHTHTFMSKHSYACFKDEISNINNFNILLQWWHSVIQTLLTSLLMFPYAALRHVCEIMRKTKVDCTASTGKVVIHSLFPHNMMSYNNSWSINRLCFGRKTAVGISSLGKYLYSICYIVSLKTLFFQDLNPSL